MSVGCAGKTVDIPWQCMPYLSTLEMWSRQGTIQIHVHLTLPYLIKHCKILSVDNTFLIVLLSHVRQTQVGHSCRVCSACTCMRVRVCVVHGHQQLHRVTTLPATHLNTASSSSSTLSSSSSVPDWVQRSVKFGSDKKPLSSSSHTSRLSVTGVGDSLCHVPLSPQSSDASSGSAGPDVDDTTSAPGMHGISCAGELFCICFHY